MNGFENQITTQLEWDAFSRFEFNTRCCTSKDKLERNIANLISQSPEILVFDWLQPLRSDYFNYIDAEHSEDDDYIPSLSNYLRSVLDKYYGSRLFFKPDDFKGLKAFTEHELNQPHMRWVKRLDEKRASYQQEIPEIKLSSAIALARYCSLNKNPIPTQKLYELFLFFFSQECDHTASMDFSVWAKWYETSRDVLDSNNMPLPEFSQEIKKSLESRTNDKLEDKIYWIEWKFEVHPFHEKHIKSWIELLDSQTV